MSNDKTNKPENISLWSVLKDAFNDVIISSFKTDPKDKNYSNARKNTTMFTEAVSWSKKQGLENIVIKPDFLQSDREPPFYDEKLSLFVNTGKFIEGLYTGTPSREKGFIVYIDPTSSNNKEGVYSKASELATLLGLNITPSTDEKIKLTSETSGLDLVKSKDIINQFKTNVKENLERINQLTAGISALVNPRESEINPPVKDNSAEPKTTNRIVSSDNIAGKSNGIRKGQNNELS